MDYDRKKQILNYLRSKNYMTVDELCEQLCVSGATVRRELTELEESRHIRRTRGGAYLVEGIANDDPHVLREQKNEMQKQIIASQALKHIRDGMTLFFDSSTTIYILARNLDTFSNLRVITNSLKTSLYLSAHKGITIMCTGGELRPGAVSLVGQSTVDYIRRHNADAVFMSTRGFSLSGGASESTEEEYFVKRAYLDNSREKYLLCDTSKMDKDYLCKTAPLSEFSKVITESLDINKRYARI